MTAQTDTTLVLSFLERLDCEKPYGWPAIDVRAQVFHRLPYPARRDPLEVLAEMHRRHQAGAALPAGFDLAELMWDTEKDMDGPTSECPECQARNDCPPGHGAERVGTLLHRGAGKIDCSIYLAAKADRECRHPWAGPWVPGDYGGCLTACCGAAWSVNDGPLYCKCCYRTIGLHVDRTEIYRMWEAPDLAHYAERIARLL